MRCHFPSCLNQISPDPAGDCANFFYASALAYVTLCLSHIKHPYAYVCAFAYASVTHVSQALQMVFHCSPRRWRYVCARMQVLGTGHRLERRGGGRAGAFLFWPTSFGDTLPIPGAEKMLTLQNSLHNLS